MKKLVVLATAIAVSAPAFATKARLTALGEGLFGSQYINDNRNIFLNSANVNNYKDLVVFELGGDGDTFNAAAGRVAKTDKDTAPQAEGGVLYGYNNLVFGAWFGAESDQTHEARQYLSFGNRAVHQDNQIDVFVGGDAGVKWGANLTYSQTKDDSIDANSKSLSTRLGVITGNFEAFANIALMNKFEGDLDASGQDEEFKGKLGYEIGGTYNLGSGNKVFVYWRHAKWEQESDVAIHNGTGGVASNAGAYQGEADATTDKYIVGWGREEKINDTTTLFTKLSYIANKRDFGTDDGDAMLKDYAVPLVIGFEHDANSHLTLRGSVAQSIINEQDNDYDASLLAETFGGGNPTGRLNILVPSKYSDGKRTVKNTTAVNAGATIKFGDFSVDSLVGTSTGGTKGVIDSENLLTRVSMTYKF